MTPPARAMALGAWMVAGGACLDVADERARRDEGVGRARAEGRSIQVEDGLAAVRLLGAQEVRLWAQAPAFGFTVQTEGTPEPLTITVDNALPDAALSLPDGQPATALPVEPGAPVTRKQWRVEASPTAVRLQLAPPDLDSLEPLRFAIYADVQERLEDVQDIYRRMNQDPRIRFALMSGDLTDMGSRRELTRFQQEMRTLSFPVYATLGNHELGAGGPPFHDLFGRGSFSFRFRGAQFTLLDSASATLAPAVYHWLDGWLAGAARSFHVVATHIPPLDPVGARNGAFASRLEAMTLLGRLAAAEVDVTFYGHVHSYYAFTNAGIPAFISGGGGGIPERLDGISRHFLTVDVDPATQLFQVAVVRVD
jgi:3',5'-cyclic-AMP phosphodiesterase